MCLNVQNQIYLASLEMPTVTQEKKMTVALIVATDSRSGCCCVLLSKLTTKITEWLTLEETCKGHLVQPPSTHGTHALMYVQFI